jgi:Rrf2 family protein
MAMAELASRHGDSRPARLVDIAQKHHIPQRFLVQILLQLKGAGLVATTRGSSGGYQLTRSPSEITLAEILAVVDPDQPPKERAASLETASAGMHAVWKKLTEAREKILRETSLAEVARTDAVPDFVI